MSENGICCNDQLYETINKKIEIFNRVSTMQNSTFTNSANKLITNEFNNLANHGIEQQQLKSCSGITILPIGLRGNSQNNLNEKIKSLSSLSYPYDDNTIPISAATSNDQTSLHNHRISLINKDSDDVGLEIMEPFENKTKTNTENRNDVSSLQTQIEIYETSDINNDTNNLSPNTSILHSAPIPPPLPPPSIIASQNPKDEPNLLTKRTFTVSIFLLEIAGLIIVYIFSMTIVLAIQENQKTFQIIKQFTFTYVYLISSVWMIWCTYDINKYRQKWIKLTSSAHNQEEYMDIVEHHTNQILYFPDKYDTGGLFMRVGTGLLCMGSIFLTVIHCAKTILMMKNASYFNRNLPPIYTSRSVSIAKSIRFLFRFIFHCVQFSFIFRYGNIVINRYNFLAKIGLIHIVIANFGTWFEAIVTETLEELHKNSLISLSNNVSITMDITKLGMKRNNPLFLKYSCLKIRKFHFMRPIKSPQN